MKRLKGLILIFFFSIKAIGQAADPGSYINLQIDGSKKYQRIDGMGVNANTRSWNGKELEPALGLLLDSMHAVVWRVIVETVEKWEDANDNNDPFVFNWDYYNKLYETPKFRKAFDMIRYLNDHGITDNLMINFMGPVPEWMGKKTVKPRYEDEYVEMIASFFYYARNTRHLKFGLVSPTNESDWHNEGPELDEKQYASVLRKLIDRMQSLGMGDVRYVAPDPAGMENGIKRYIPELMKDPVIMSKIAHFGLHSYGGYYADIDSALKHSPYPQSDYWVTEWNAWRDGLDDGKIGVYDYHFASQSVGFMLDLLRHNATSLMAWEGYDSYYEHHAPSLFSYWGILGYNADSKTYTARKHLYAIGQFSKFVLPGSRRIDISEAGKDLNVIAFLDSLNRVSIVGINKKNIPVTVSGTLSGLPLINSLACYHTSSMDNLHQDADVPVSARKFTVTVPADCIFTLTANKGEAKKMPALETPGWYTGDIHVHRNCGGNDVLPEEKLPGMMETNNLDVISLLADMGNGEVKYSKEDLFKINGKDAPQSAPGRIIHWDTEWHYDATYGQFDHQALGGHLVLLGLQNARQIWAESPYQILDWAHAQGAVKGFAHMEYLNDQIQSELNCCIPIDYPVEAALGSIDFVSEDVYGIHSPNNGNYNSEAVINAYYKLLNCGFRIALAAGTDYPCNENEPLGTLLTYVEIPDKNISYRKWIDGIAAGRTVVSRNGRNEFLELKVNAKGPGSEIRLRKGQKVSIKVSWSANTASSGGVELVSNGKVIARQTGAASPGAPFVLTSTQPFTQSGWICARRMDASGHVLHTSPVYIRVDDQPVRASAADAAFFESWIDNVLSKIEPGGPWSKYFPETLETIKARYIKARDIYKKIGMEAAQKK